MEIYNDLALLTVGVDDDDEMKQVDLNERAEKRLRIVEAKNEAPNAIL